MISFKLDFSKRQKEKGILLYLLHFSVFFFKLKCCFYNVSKKIFLEEGEG